jgi:hypothetical protein
MDVQAGVWGQMSRAGASDHTCAAHMGLELKQNLRHMCGTTDEGIRTAQAQALQPAAMKPPSNMRLRLPCELEWVNQWMDLGLVSQREHGNVKGPRSHSERVPLAGEHSGEPRGVVKHADLRHQQRHTAGDDTSAQQSRCAQQPSAEHAPRMYEGTKPGSCELSKLGILGATGTQPHSSLLLQQ